MAFFVLSTPGAPADPSSYTLTALPTCASPKTHVCYIVAISNGNNQPVITFPLLREIATALNTGTESLNVKLKP